MPDLISPFSKAKSEYHNLFQPIDYFVKPIQSYQQICFRSLFFTINIIPYMCFLSWKPGFLYYLKWKCVPTPHLISYGYHHIPAILAYESLFYCLFVSSLSSLPLLCFVPTTGTHFWRFLSSLLSLQRQRTPCFEVVEVVSLAMAKDMENVKYEEEFISNSRGMKLFTCQWLPINQEPKALIFLCHGYAVECSITMKGTGIRLAKAGFAVYGMDYLGHGKSSGLQGYIPNFDELVNDCSDYFTSICEKKENKKKLKFLLGESMGGAVALFLHRKSPKYWNGAILVAPMCKIADEMKPPQAVIKILTMLSKVIPTWKIIPTQDIIDIAIKDPEKRVEARSNQYCYKERPRLKTGNQLLMASLEIEQKLQEVSLPFLIVHGGDDKVTDPSVSKLLYESAYSTDKTFKLYPGMWHALTSGEPPENIDLVFSDIIAWLDQRSIAVDLRSERERKAKFDHPSLALLGEKVIS